MESRNNPYFMIIDDDPVNNRLCTVYIKKLFSDAEIISFTDPLKALAFIKSTYAGPEKKETMLLLDLMMPVASGWDFLDVIDTFSDDVKHQFNIYILSSSVDNADKQRAGNNPLVYGYFEKPLTVKQLESMFLVKKYKNNFLNRLNKRTYKNEHYIITLEDRKILDMLLPYFHLNEVINIRKSIRSAHNGNSDALQNVPINAHSDRISAFLIAYGFANNLCGEPVINIKGMDLMNAKSLGDFEKKVAQNS